MHFAYAPFLHQVFAALQRDGVDVSAFELDHVCYRVATVARYGELKGQLLRTNILLSETLIAGRPIASFRLAEPFLFEGRRIEVLELPSPKEGSPYPEGFEHVEFVVDEDLLAFTQRYPYLQWDLSDIGKPTNPDVCLRYPTFNVKFHRHPLAYVIEHLDPR